MNQLKSAILEAKNKNYYRASPPFNSYSILSKHGGQKQEKNVLALE